MFNTQIASLALQCYQQESSLGAAGQSAQQQSSTAGWRGGGEVQGDGAPLSTSWQSAHIIAWVTKDGYATLRPLFMHFASIFGSGLKSFSVSNPAKLSAL